jgi:hypothetical protein
MSSLIQVTIAKSEFDFATEIERISKNMLDLKSPFEIMTARARAMFVGDMAKKRANIAKKELAKDPEFKSAFDKIIRECYQFEQDALFLRRTAEIMLYYDYENGVDEGRYAPRGAPSEKPKTGSAALFTEKPKTQTELGIKHEDMSKFRRSAAVEKEFPGIVETKIIEGTLAGEEPTITKVHTVEKTLFQQIKEKFRSTKKETKEEAKQQRQEKNAVHDEFIENLNLPPIWKERFKVGSGQELEQFTIDFCSRLEKEKIKLEEIMFHYERLSIYVRRKQLPQILGEVGDFFLECAKILKNQEHVPNMEKLTVVNPQET